MQNLDSYIKKGRQTIFNVTSIVAIFGYTLDILDFYKSSSILLYNNATTIFLTLLPFLLFHLQKMSIRQAFTIIVYAAICNVMVDTFTELTNPFRINFFLRDSLFIVFIFTLAALLIHKIHSLIITIIYIIMAIVITILLKNEFITSSIAMIILFVTAYSAVIYYFVDILERTVREREQQNRIIYDQNKEVNEINTLLEERQQQIEEQNKELQAQRDKLKELNITKDRFFSIIAHDLKTPFNTIIGFADLLRTKHNVWTKAKSNQAINAIYKSSCLLYKLLENLLSWAQSQQGLLPFNPVKLNLENTIKNVLLLMNESIEKKNQIVDYDIQPVNLIVYADADMLHTILRNLLSNAIKFSHHGGKIHIIAYQDSNIVRILVKDNGTGMEEKVRSQLFKITKNKSQAGTDKEEGTGLGLLLCQEFVLKHNGKINVESRLGEGSVFIIELPRTKPIKNVY